MREPVPPFADMVHVTIMVPETGEYLNRISGRARNTQRHHQPGTVMVAGHHDGLKVYWTADGDRDRPQLQIDTVKGTVGGVNFRVAGIPNPTPVTVLTPTSRYDETVTDGELEFCGDLPGTYSFHFQPPFPWQELRYELVLR